jgi:hypothetical protein
MDFASGQFRLFGVSGAELKTSSPPTSPLSGGPALEVRGTNAAWFETIGEAAVPKMPTFVDVRLFAIEGVASLPHHDPIDTWLGIAHTGLLSAPEGDFDGTIQVDCPVASPPTPLPARWSSIDISESAVVDDGRDLTTSTDANVPVILGKAFRAIAAPDPLPVDLPKGYLLTLEIWLRKDDEYSISLGDLGLTAAHDRFWARLPTDEQVYNDSDPFDAESPSTILWRQVGDLFRFPLAGPAKI